MTGVHPKVKGAAAGTALATVVVWALSLIVSVPAPVDVAFSTLGAFAGGWLTHDDG